MIRTTTNGVLKGYRYHLQRSSYTLNKATNTVLTQRNFDTFAEDPATAARCFQMRRSFQQVSSQHDIGESVVRKYDQAWSVLGKVVDDVDNRISSSSYAEILSSLNDATASGRNALGQSLTQLADGIVQAMNARYGDNFVFAGADGLNVPFTWEGEGENRHLCYRGMNVDDPACQEKLKALCEGEKKYVDIGFGLKEDADGNVIDSSVFDSALHGIEFLGYGVDDQGDPQNIVSIISKMGQILSRCDSESGSWAPGTDDKEAFQRLAKKFESSADILQDKYTALDTRSNFIKSNQKQLVHNADTLQEQFLGLEDVNLADAISYLAWSQHCYNAALKVGNGILSQSLMDYLQF